MAVQSGQRDSLPDLGDGGDNVLVLDEYVDDEDQMVAEIGDTETEFDSSVQGHSEQFLTISQGENHISVNDDGSIIYSDQTLALSDSALPEVQDAEETLATLDGNTYYLQSSDGLENQTLEEENMMETENDNEDYGNTFILNKADGTLTPIHTSNSGSGRFVIKNDVRGAVSQMKIKRPATFVTQPKGKVFMQSTSAGPVFKRSVVKTAISSNQPTSITMNQATRLKLLQQQAGPGNRVFVKKVNSIAGSSNVVIKPSGMVLSRPGATVVKPVRGIPAGTQLMNVIKPGTGNPRTVTLGRTLSGLSVAGRSPPKVIMRPAVRPVQIGGRFVKIQGNNWVQPQKSKVIGLTKTVPPQLVQKSGRKVMLVDGKPQNWGSLLKPNSTQIKLKMAQPKEEIMENFVIKQESEVKVEKELEPNKKTIDDDMEKDPDDEDEMELLGDERAPQRLLEANGIRPKKPCNCTRSQCLKLYCECFANGEFCFECNCNNCYNNIENEEERQQSIKNCLERNPDAFRRKPQVATALSDSDAEEERRPNRGCNCKKTHCLKNYCECFEGKLTCIKTCKCTGCRNTEEDMAAWMRGETIDSGDENRDRETLDKGSPFMPKALAEALCHCILVKADEADRNGEDQVTTEMRIIEELGQRLVQIIGNRSKKDKS